jgi:CheY-like chemotaxis protein
MEQRYDLVLMDVLMPGMEGYRAAELMRDWERKQGFRRTPIIALAIHDCEEERRKSLASGCDGLVSKPVSRKTLLEIIGKYRGGSSVQREWENTIVVQTDKNLADLVPGYLDNRRKDITCMTQALKRGDYEMIRIMARSLKGSVGAFGLDAIPDIGNALEQAAKQKNAEETARWIAELSVYLARLKIVYVEPEPDLISI